MVTRKIDAADVIATCDSYESLRLALCERRAQCKLTFSEMDSRTRLADGFCSKAFLGTRNMGASLGPILQALGLRIALIEVPQAERQQEAEAA